MAAKTVKVLPSDLIMEIVSRLPVKSIGRCRCLSKLWASLLTPGPGSELFLTQSKTPPRLLFAIKREDEEWYLYSSPQISYENSVTVEFHMSTPKTKLIRGIAPLSGLVYITNMPTSNTPMLCNPRTRHTFCLPKLRRADCSFFGYNPIKKQFSVLAVCSRSRSRKVLPSRYKILNLESGKLSWRSLDCPKRHYPISMGVNINGILYYLATSWRDNDSWKIVCFDLNSEEFNFIDAPWLNSGGVFLVNFKGKLAGISIRQVKYRDDAELSLYVLEDREKEEWCKEVHILPFTLWEPILECHRFVGVTATGDLVLSKSHITHPFYVYFYNLDKKIVRRIKIKGLKKFRPSSLLYTCVDYVEDLKTLNWS